MWRMFEEKAEKSCIYRIIKLLSRSADNFPQLNCYLPKEKKLNNLYHLVSLSVNEGESHLVVSNSLWPHGLYSPWNFPGQNTGVGSLSLLQEIFPTQGSNPGLLHCRQILYQLSHKGSPSANEKNYLVQKSFWSCKSIYCKSDL